jgi:hypothetical protein
MRNYFYFCIALTLVLCLGYTQTLSTEFDDYLENPYRVFRLPPWSSMEEIKKKYNELVRKYHPDKNKYSGDKFIKIQKAYERLKEVRKIEKDEFEDIEDPFYSAVQETLQLTAVIALAFSMIYLFFWIGFKVYSFIWLFMLYMSITFIFVDKLIPHYFKDQTSQYTSSFLIGLILYYRPIVYGFLTCCKKERNGDV